MWCGWTDDLRMRASHRKAWRRRFGGALLVTLSVMYLEFKAHLTKARCLLRCHFWHIYINLSLGDKRTIYEMGLGDMVSGHFNFQLPDHSIFAGKSLHNDNPLAIVSFLPDCPSSEQCLLPSGWDACAAISDNFPTYWGILCAIWPRMFPPVPECFLKYLNVSSSTWRFPREHDGYLK